MMAVKVPDLSAAVPFYGGQPKEDVDKINAPLMLQFAGLDERVNAGWPAYEQALKANGKEYEAFTYPDVNHGFHNTSTPRYNKEPLNWLGAGPLNFLKNTLVNGQIFKKNISSKDFIGLGCGGGIHLVS